jgi:hypothetical protein
VDFCGRLHEITHRFQTQRAQSGDRVTIYERVAR